MRTKVLIVDDEQLALTTMSLILGSEHDVETATSPDEAMEMFEPGRFAVIVSDFKMPGSRTGVDLLEEMGRLDSHCARILLTAYGDREAIIDAVNRAKIYLYLDKPCEPSRLQMAVRRAAEHWQLSREREHLTERLHDIEKVAAVGRFSSGVSHDIKNYLVPLLVASEEQDPSEMGAALVAARKASEAILALVEEMAALAKGRRPTYRMRPGSATKILEEAMRWTRHLPVAKRCETLIGIDEVPTVHLSEGSLRRVFINLLKNAYEASSDGGTVQVRATTRQGDVVISIHDEGCGMSPELAESCFEPFMSTKGDDGTGIGLYTCRAIIAGHGGTIGLVTEEGKGTTFTVKLPVA